MRKLLIATVASAGLLALGACTQPAAEEDASADTAETAGADASADTSYSGGGSGADAASSSTSSGGDMSSGGGDASGSASGDASSATASGTNDPMATGQGSMREENPNRGQIDMPSEPAHPARQ